MFESLYQTQLSTFTPPVWGIFIPGVPDVHVSRVFSTSRFPGLTPWTPMLSVTLNYLDVPLLKQHLSLKLTSFLFCLKNKASKI